MTSELRMIQDALLGMEEELMQPVPFAGLEKHRESLLSMIGQLKSGIDDSARPLRILFAGGTGVGKSTLLNALAGAEIAETGEKRPCTRKHTVFIHESDSDAWVESMNDVRVVRHARAELRHKVIIDAPDADSAVAANHRVLEKALELADLVMVVVSQEKYASFCVGSMLGRYRTGRRFVFVLNKADQDPPVEIINDLRWMLDRSGFAEAPLFRVSALNQLNANGAPDPGAGADETSPGLEASDCDPAGRYQDLSDFKALEYYIGEALTAVRVMELMQSNRNERFGLLVDSIEGVLPETTDALVVEWNKRWKESMQSFLCELESVIRESILTDEKLKLLVMERKTMVLGGIFGFFARLAYALRRLLSSRQSFGGSGHEREMEMECMDAADCDRVSSANTRMRMEWLSSARSLGLNPDVSGLDWGRTCDPGAEEPVYPQTFFLHPISLVLDEEIPPVADGSENERPRRELPWTNVWPQHQIAAALQGSIFSQIRKRLRSHVKPVNVFGRCLLNLPAFAWIVYMGWKIAEPVRWFETPRVELAPGAFLVLIAILTVQWLACDRILEWWAKRFADNLRKIVTFRILGDVAGVISVGPNRVERRLLRFTERFEVLKRTRASVVGERTLTERKIAH